MELNTLADDEDTKPLLQTHWDDTLKPGRRRKKPSVQQAQATTMGILCVLMLVLIFLFVTPRKTSSKSVVQTTAKQQNDTPSVQTTELCHLSSHCLNLSHPFPPVALPKGVPSLRSLSFGAWDWTSSSNLRGCGDILSGEWGAVSSCDSDDTPCDDVSGFGAWRVGNIKQSRCGMRTFVDDVPCATTSLTRMAYETSRTGFRNSDNGQGASNRIQVNCRLRTSQDVSGFHGMLLNCSFTHPNASKSLAEHTASFEIIPEWMFIESEADEPHIANRFNHSLHSADKLLAGHAISVRDTVTGATGVIGVTVPTKIAHVHFKKLTQSSLVTLRFSETAPHQAWVCVVVLLSRSETDSATSMIPVLEAWARPHHFQQLWAVHQLAWDRTWASAFTPNNTVFSGHLPVLFADNTAVADLYYASVLALLTRFRVDLSPHIKRTFVTDRVVTSTRISFVQLGYISTILSLLDPVAVGELLVHIFSCSDPSSHRRVDTLSCGGEGPGNHFVTPALFWAVESYLLSTNNVTFAHVPVFNKALNRTMTPLDWMEAFALEWTLPKYKSLSVAHKHLADYGSNPKTLLECSPSYLHVVPALQAQNVYMMRSLANIRQEQSNKTESSRLRAVARTVATATVRSLWVDGSWNTLEVVESEKGLDLEVIDTTTNQQTINATTITTNPTANTTANTINTISTINTVTTINTNTNSSNSTTSTSDANITATTSPSNSTNAANTVDTVDNHNPIHLNNPVSRTHVRGMVIDIGFIAHGMLQDLAPRDRAAMADRLFAKWHARLGTHASDGALSLQALGLLEGKFLRMVSLAGDVRPLNGDWGGGCGGVARDGGGAFAEVVLRTLFGVRFLVGGQHSLLMPKISRGFEGKVEGVRTPAGGTISVCTNPMGVWLC